MTKTESNRITRMMRLGCVACAYSGVTHIAQECHHILDGNRRMGHAFTLPLCRGHHQGDWSAEQREILGDRCVSISDGRKAFTAVYPTEQKLWERVQTRLKLPKLWPVSKILPRKTA
jgi:hypothetical protein